MFSFFAYADTAWVPVPKSDSETAQHPALTDAELVQVGLVAHAAPNASGEVVAKVRYIDFIPVTTTCVDALPPDPLNHN